MVLMRCNRLMAVKVKKKSCGHLVKFSCSSGRNNKSRLFLLLAALRVSPRAEERTLEISSERKKVQSVERIHCTTAHKGQVKTAWREQESFSIHAGFTALMFDLLFTNTTSLYF